MEALEKHTVTHCVVASMLSNVCSKSVISFIAEGKKTIIMNMCLVHNQFQVDFAD